MLLSWQILFSPIVARPHGILPNNKWIYGDMRTELHYRWWRTKIIRTHHFSRQSKVFPKLHTPTITDRPTVTDCQGWNAGQQCESIKIASPIDNSGMYLSLAILHNPSHLLTAENSWGSEVVDHNFCYCSYQSITIITINSSNKRASWIRHHNQNQFIQ
jgi:hypothetical protein